MVTVVRTEADPEAKLRALKLELLRDQETKSAKCFGAVVKASEDAGAVAPRKVCISIMKKHVCKIKVSPKKFI